MRAAYDLPVDYTCLHWTEKKAVREQYVREQEGKCFYCESNLDEPPPQKITALRIDWSFFPENFLKHSVHLQHDHGTGLTEGAVHSYCNAVMWQYEGK